MKKSLSFILFCIIAGLVFSANGFADDLSCFKNQTGTIRIAGGTAHIPVMEKAAKQIMAANPQIKITVAGGGSGAGVKQVGEGLVNIGNTGRKPTDEEIAKYHLKMFKWAIDGVGVVVNPSNPVKNITKQQLKDIFSGKTTNWKDVRGEDRQIVVYTRDNSSGTREVFFEKGLDKGEILPQANVVASNGAMKTAVAADPNGIGYVSVGHIDQSVAPVALDGIRPTIETVKSGQYIISRGLYSNTKGDPDPLTQCFLDYLTSKEGQKLIAEKGFIPVTE